MTGYYDVVLGLIPLALAGVSTSLVGLGVELTVAITAASMVAVALIGHAMFVNSPVSAAAETNTQTETGYQSAD